MQKTNIFMDRFECTGRLEKHEAKLKGQIKAFQNLNSVKVLLHRNLLVERLQSFLGARFESHIYEIETRFAQFREQIRVYSVRAAADLPDYLAYQAAHVQFSNELSRPTLPNGTKQREIVILK